MRPPSLPLEGALEHGTLCLPVEEFLGDEVVGLLACWPSEPVNHAVYPDALCRLRLQQALIRKVGPEQKPISVYFTPSYRAGTSSHQFSRTNLGKW